MSNHKLGRNDPCWCGSGEKYKRCHLNRERESSASPWDIFKGFKQPFEAKMCLAPESWRSDCTAIARAHTVPKSSIRQIARDGKVYSFVPHPKEFERHEGVLYPQLVGINQASTFTGFCSRHDNAIFVPLEKRAFSGTIEQCFLLAFRSVTRELYTKRAALDSNAILMKANIGQPPWLRQMRVGYELAIRDLEYYKSRYDTALIEKDFGSLEAYVLEFEDPPPVMCSGAILPTEDYRGVELQDLSNFDKIPDLLCFTSFYGKDRGIVAFSWLSEKGEACHQYIESLKAILDQKLALALLRIFLQCENVYIAPAWWESLGEEAKAALVDHLSTSASPAKASPSLVLASDDVPFDPWAVACRYDVALR